MAKFIFIKIIILFAFVTSCGYSFEGDNSHLPVDIKTVYIPLVQNKTTWIVLSSNFTNSLRREFNHYGSLKVLDDPDTADTILVVTIEEIKTSVSAVDAKTDIEVGQDISITVSAEFKRRNGQVLWQNGHITGSESYATVKKNIVTTSFEFMETQMSSKQIDALTQREIARAQSRTTLDNLIDQMVKRIYFDAVASDF